jgi:hypothetical protein
VATNGYLPPDMTNTSKLRVSVADSDVYFDYADILGNLHTWRSSPLNPTSLWQSSAPSGWWPYDYTRGVQLHYWEELPAPPLNTNPSPPRLFECTTLGYLETATPAVSGDDGVAFVSFVQTPSPAPGDGKERTQNLYVDFMLDFQGEVNITPLFDYAQTPGSLSDLLSQPLSTPLVRNQIIQPLLPQPQQPSLTGPQAPPWAMPLHWNLGLNISFASTSNTALFAWEPSYYIQPVLVKEMVTQFTNHGIPGWKLSRYARICAMSFTDLILEVEVEGRNFQYRLPFSAISNSVQLQTMDVNLTAFQKGRLFSWYLHLPPDAPVGSQFVLFPEETFVRMKHWKGDTFQEVPVFLAHP